MQPNDDTSLTISRADAALLNQMLFTADGHENFAVLLCGEVTRPDRRRLLVRDLIPAPPGAYRKRLEDHLTISPDFFNEVVSASLRTGLTPVVAHSHPMSDEARYSPTDDFGELRLLPVLGQLLPDRSPASLLLSRQQMIGRRLIDGAFHAFAAVTVSDISTTRYGREPIPPGVSEGDQYDRVVRAIGCYGHGRLRQLRVGIVGVGGTGSAVAEQIARLGVKEIVLVDPDRVEPSNLPRIYGATHEDIARSSLKVDVIARHLGAIQPELLLRTVAESAVRQPVLLELSDLDLVFGCTDNHLSRAVLNRFAHQYLVPVVDMGVRLDARSGSVTAAAGRVSVVGVGMTCLRCSGHIDPERVRAEALPAGERANLARDGYVQGIDDPEPAVISLNTMVAATAVTVAIGMYTNLVGAPPAVNQIIDFRDGTTFAVSPVHLASCDVCTAGGGLKGLGDGQIVSAYE
jgi:molybdopterin-synthase adenylyltransferase